MFPKMKKNVLFPENWSPLESPPVNKIKTEMLSYFMTECF